MSEALRGRILALRDHLPDMRDAEALSFESEVLLVELEALPPVQRMALRSEIAALISALETHILALETNLKR